MIRPALAILGTASLLARLSIASAPAVPSAQPSGLLTYLDRYVNLPADARARLLHGGVVSASLDADPSSEIAVFGAAWIDAPISRYLAALRDIDHFESGRSFRITRRISSPPRIEDFADLTLPAHDARDLQACRVARCDLKLSREAIERMQREVEWSRSDAPDQIDRSARRMLFDYVTGYLQEGNARLAVYHDAERPTAVAQEFAALVDRVPSLAELFPDVRRYLLEFPRVSLPDSDSFLYWQETKFGLKPTIRVNHVIIAERRDGAIVASKMIYATHYFRSALEVRVLLRDPARGDGFWLLTESRTRPDGLSGVAGHIIRARVRAESERGAAAQVLSTKTRLEAR